MSYQTMNPWDDEFDPETIGVFRPSITGITPSQVRIDFLGFQFDMEPDRFHQVYSTLSDWALEVWDREGNLPSKTHVVAANKERGTRSYQVIFWGEFADELTERLNPEFLRYVVRLDYRIEFPFGKNALEHFHSYVLANRKGNRNVVKQDSRQRTKQVGRDAGGTSVAVGSKGSQVRLIAYRRGLEFGAVEVNVKGDALKDYIEGANKGMENSPDLGIGWHLKSQLELCLDDMAVASGFNNDQALVDYLKAHHVPHREGSDAEDDTALLMRNQFELLPESTKRRVSRLLGINFEPDKPDAV